MNLETLRQKLLAQTTTLEVGGTSYRLAKLGARDGMEVNDFLISMKMEGEGEDRKAADPAELVQLYCLILSKSVVDESGQKPLDSDEGRELLGRLPRDEFMQLGEAAMDWSSAGSQKKS